jgi:hypothetical protein
MNNFHNVESNSCGVTLSIHLMQWHINIGNTKTKMISGKSTILENGNVLNDNSLNEILLDEGEWSEKIK